jgi:hypothetical protein
VGVDSTPAVAAESKTAGTSPPIENLGQQFVAALLTPMSQLVQSPYADPRAAENPLGPPAKSPAIATHPAAMNSGLTQINVMPLESTDEEIWVPDSDLLRSALSPDNSALATTGP